MKKIRLSFSPILYETEIQKGRDTVQGKKKKGLSRKFAVRLKIVMLIMVVAVFLLPFGSLFKLMVIQSASLQAKAAAQQLYDTEISAGRGDIYDRNHTLLATSATVWTVYVTPNEFSTVKTDEAREATKEEIATNLSEILELDKNSVMEKLNKKSSYVVIKRQVEQPQADKINAYISASDYGVGQFIGMDEATKRYYPNGNLASVLLGFVGTDNQGLSGIEAYYDNNLTGTPGRVVAAKTANGVGMPFSYETIVEAKQGDTLVLSIDSYIQYVCEKYLVQAINDNLVRERGGIVAMNVNTGEILAMAVKGDFDPNSPFELSDEDKAITDMLEGDEYNKKVAELRNRQWRNKLISDTYEPGSVFKLVTVSSCLEEECVSLSSTFNCSGYIVVAGQRYRCVETKGHGKMNLTLAMMNSCNPAFITMGNRLGAQKFSSYFEAFGLTQKTGIDLPGESGSVYHSEEKMGITELSSSSFGQTFTVTPIQLITACCATVNGGYLVQPHIVNQILDSDGNVKKNISTTTKRQVISGKTSETVRVLAEAVVNGGGGRNAYVAGYRIGGKTGTAQKVNKMIETGETGLYVASFLAIAPIDDPEIAVLIVLDEPMGESYYGGTICTTVSASLMAEVLPYLGYEPQYTEKELANLAVKVPDVIDKDVTAAKSSVTNAGLTAQIVGEGEKVINQLPDSTQSILKNGTVILYTDEESTAKTVTVPNFLKLTAAGVNEIAIRNGLNVQFSGAAVTQTGVTAYKQSIDPGTEVEQGTIITVYFKDSTIQD